MRRIGWTALVVLAGCGSAPVQRPLSATLVEATVETRCVSDAGLRCRGEPFVNQPLCGFDVGELDPSSEAVTVETGQPASSLVGVWEVRTTAIDEQGQAQPLRQRRGVVTSSVPTATVYGTVLAPGALYQLSATGRLTPLPDAGAVDTDDAGASVFSYQVSSADGGTLVVTEHHRVVATWQVQASVNDHSGDPFYGCCAHVGSAAPMALLAALVLLRRRRGMPREGRSR